MASPSPSRPGTVSPSSSSRPGRVVVVAFGPAEVTSEARRRAARLVGPGGDVVVVAAHRGAAPAAGTPVGTDGLRAALDVGDMPVLVLHDDVLIGRDGVAALLRAWRSTGAVAVPWSNVPGTDHHLDEPVPADDGARMRLARRLPLRGGLAPTVRPLCLLATGTRLRELAARFPTVNDTVWSDPAVATVVAGNALAHHAERCVGAQPVTIAGEPLLVASMIVRDEAAVLADCLASLDGLVDRIEICDPGSTDDTVAIAESFGADVIHREWRDDFGWARNEVLERCRDAAYILQIDADERARCADPAFVRRRLALLRDSVRILSVAIDNLDDAGNVASTHDGPRIIRTDGIVYRGALHERPHALDGAQLLSLELKPLRLEHLGYRHAVVVERDKSDRNVVISERAYQESPNWETAFQYARSLSLSGQDGDGRVTELLQETLAAGDEVPVTWRAWALGKLARDALTAGDADHALNLAQQALVLVPADATAGAVLTEAAERLGRSDLIVAQRSIRRSTVSLKPFTRLAAASAQRAGAEVAALLAHGDTDEAYTEAQAALAADPVNFRAWPALVRSVAGAPDAASVDALLVSAALSDRTGDCVTAIARSLPPARAARLCGRYIRQGGDDPQAVRNGIATALVAAEPALVDQFLPHAHRLEPAVLEHLADVATQRGLAPQGADLRALAALPRRNFVICGSAHSGTGRMSRMLSALGHTCGHELVFDPFKRVPVFGAMQGDASWFAMPHLDELPADAVIFHQVRDPLEVVRALAGSGLLTTPSPALDFVAAHAPEVLDEPDELSRCMAYWVAWNDRLARHADGDRPYVRYQVEAIDAEVLAQLVSLLGSAQSPEAVQQRLDRVDDDDAAPVDPTVTLASLPEGPAKARMLELAAELGYEDEPVAV